MGPAVLVRRKRDLRFVPSGFDADQISRVLGQQECQIDNRSKYRDGNRLQCDRSLPGTHEALNSWRARIG